MEAGNQSTKKEKRPRGTNWAADGLKVLLEMGILRRVKIKGCEAVGDVKDGALKEISDAVSATGQPKTPQECLNKLRTYPSEVKNKYLGIARETVNKTGAAGGESVKLLNPSPVEELAMAFLGIEKISGIVGGRKTSLKPRVDFDYVAERTKERKAGADLEKKLKKVTAEAKKAARKKYLSQEEESTDDESDSDSLLEDRRKTVRRGKTQAQHPSVGVLNRIVDTLDRMEDRLIRIEQKGDDMQEAISNLKIDNPNEATGGADDTKTSDSSEDRNEAIINPPKPEPPKILAVPFHVVKSAFEDFLKNASDDDWDEIMKAAVTRKSDMKKVRERVYLRILYDMSEEDIDGIQEYFIQHFPQFIKDTILTKNNYHVLTALGCDLVAYGKFVNFITEPEILEGAKQCRVIRDVTQGHPGAGDAGVSEATANGTLEPTDNHTATTSSDHAMDVQNENEEVTPPKGATAIPRRTPARKSTPRSTRKGKDGENKDADKSPAKARPANKGAKAKDSSTGAAQDDSSEQDKDSAPIPKKAKRGRPKK